jgi:hypothetical protein
VIRGSRISGDRRQVALWQERTVSLHERPSYLESNLRYLRALSLPSRRKCCFGECLCIGASVFRPSPAPKDVRIKCSQDSVFRSKYLVKSSSVDEKPKEVCCFRTARMSSWSVGGFKRHGWSETSLMCFLQSVSLSNSTGSFAVP